MSFFLQTEQTGWIIAGQNNADRAVRVLSEVRSPAELATTQNHRRKIAIAQGSARKVES